MHFSREGVNNFHQILKRVRDSKKVKNPCFISSLWWQFYTSLLHEPYLDIPERVVIVQMSSQLNKKMSSDLLDLLTDLTDLRNEDGGMVEKVTSGVATGMCTNFTL